MVKSFVSHAFSADAHGNARLVTRIARELVVRRHLPLAPQIYLPRFIDETSERDLALKLCLALVALSDELRVYGERTAGVLLEIAEAHRLGIPVVDGVTGEWLLPKGEPPR